MSRGGLLCASGCVGSIWLLRLIAEPQLPQLAQRLCALTGAVTQRLVTLCMQWTHLCSPDWGPPRAI